MKTIIPLILIIALCSCGSGDTRDGYTSDTSGLNENTDQYYENNAPAGARGTPANSEDTTIRMNMNRPGRDTAY